MAGRSPTSATFRTSRSIRRRAVPAGLVADRAVYALADAAGTPSVYWLTQEFNTTARPALRPHLPPHPLHQIRALSRPVRLVASLACLALAACASALARPPGRRACPSRSPRSASAQAILPRGRALQRRLGRGLPRPHLPVKNGEKLSHLLRYETPVRLYLALTGPRGRIAPTSPPSSSASAPRPASTSPRPTIPPRRRSSSDGAGGADRQGLPLRGLLHRSRRDRLDGASCAAAPRPGCAGPIRRRCTEAAIFLPLDTTPQDVRDCLAEEITQALGPADDLYRCPTRSGTTTTSTAWRRPST